MAFAEIAVTLTEVSLMTYKQIEASRELRLWIGQVIIPAIGVSAALLSNPEIRRRASEKLEDIKMKIRRKRVRVL